MSQHHSYTAEARLTKVLQSSIKIIHNSSAVDLPNTYSLKVQLFLIFVSVLSTHTDLPTLPLLSSGVVHKL